MNKPSAHDPSKPLPWYLRCRRNDLPTWRPKLLMTYVDEQGRTVHVYEPAWANGVRPEASAQKHPPANLVARSTQ